MQLDFGVVTNVQNAQRKKKALEISLAHYLRYLGCLFGMYLYIL